MASYKISTLKFVGTVSLGLLTGASYTLSTFTVPALLELPSASSAAKAFRSLTRNSSTHLRTLTNISGSAFFLAFVLSPRGYRHPYLLYTSIFAVASGLTDYVTLSLFSVIPPSQPSSSSQKKEARRERQTALRMEQSYDFTNDSHSDEGATMSASGDDLHEDDIDPNTDEVNGEGVRREVDFFVRNQMVQTAVAGLGFAIAVIGIWGDAVYNLASNSETFYIELS